jgi:hypothetical protein
MKPKKSDITETHQAPEHVIPNDIQKLIGMLTAFVARNNLILAGAKSNLKCQDENRLVVVRYITPDIPESVGILDVITKPIIQQYNHTYRTIATLIPKSQSSIGHTTQDFIRDVNNIDEAYKILTDNILLGSI